MASLRSPLLRLLDTVAFTAEERERTLAWERTQVAEVRRIAVRIVGDHERLRTEESIRAQSIPPGDSAFTLLLQSGSELHPSALYILGKELLHETKRCFYWDELLLAPEPQMYRKGPFSSLSALGRPLLGGAALLSQELLPKELDSVEIFLWKLALELNESEVSYIPLPLSTRQIDCPAPPSFSEELQAPIREQLAPYGLENLEFDLSHYPPRTTFTLRQDEPIGVIIPFRDASALTTQALRSLAAQENASFLDVVLIDNGSRESERSLVESCLESLPFRSAKILSDARAFNFARLCNAGWRALPDVRSVLFMNNDIELPDRSVCAKLVPFISLPGVGIVGGALTYPSGRIQSSGITFDGPTNIRLPEHLPETFREVEGVTFGFALIKRELLEQLHGLDEIHCPNGFGDALFCHRARLLGFRSAIVPWLRAVHHESPTRRRRSEELEIYELHREGVRTPLFSPSFHPTFMPLPLEESAFLSIVKYIRRSPKLLRLAESCAQTILRLGRTLRRRI